MISFPFIIWFQNFITQTISDYSIGIFWLYNSLFMHSVNIITNPSIHSWSIKTIVKMLRLSSPSSLEPIATDINDDPGRRFFAIFAFTCQLLLGYHCHQGRFSPLHLLILKIYFYITDICCVLHSPHPCTCSRALNFGQNFWLWLLVAKMPNCPVFSAQHPT